MLEWTLLILMLAVAGAAAWVSLRHRHRHDEHILEHRRRYRLPAAGPRVPLQSPASPGANPSAPSATSGATGGKSASLNALLRAIHEDEQARLAEAPDPAAAPAEPIRYRPGPEFVHRPPDPNGTIGRVVRTIEGEEIILTAPPFQARRSIFSDRQGRYVLALSRRLPPWIVVCPRVRLDALVKPTPPEGRDPADWRQWRRRVRWRAIDVLLCDARSWRPVLALDIGKPSEALDIRKPGGGNDLMLEEVFFTVGIPFLRGSGDIHADWPMIRPHVEEAILVTRDPCVEGDGPSDHADGSVPNGPAIVGLLDEGLLVDAQDDHPHAGAAPSSDR